MPESGFGKLVVSRKTGNERLHCNGEPLEHSLIDFWRWSISDLVSNATRGILAEYIVACAVGASGGIRPEWDAYDVITPEGIRIEVKSACYLQTWTQRRLSTIVFGIRPTRGWDADTNDWDETAKRQSDVYVFCLLKHIDKTSVDPLNLAQWEFFVLPTRILDERLPMQNSLRMSTLLKLGPAKATFNELRDCIQAAAREESRGES